MKIQEMETETKSISKKIVKNNESDEEDDDYAELDSQDEAFRENEEDANPTLIDWKKDEEPDAEGSDDADAEHESEVYPPEEVFEFCGVETHPESEFASVKFEPSSEASAPRAVGIYPMFDFSDEDDFSEFNIKIECIDSEPVSRNSESYDFHGFSESSLLSKIDTEMTSVQDKLLNPEQQQKDQEQHQRQHQEEHGRQLEEEQQRQHQEEQQRQQEEQHHRQQEGEPEQEQERKCFIKFDHTYARRCVSSKTSGSETDDASNIQSVSMVRLLTNLLILLYLDQYQYYINTTNLNVLP